MSEATDRPNKIRIQHGVYIVRTQAGFKSAIKETFEDFRSMQVFGYPTVYPALVTITMGYNGGEVIMCHSVPLSKLKPIVNSQ